MIGISRRPVAVLAVLTAVLAIGGCANGPGGSFWNASSTESTVPSGSVAAKLSRTLVRVANAAREAGDPATALPLYRRAGRLDSTVPAPWVGLGLALDALGSHTKAAAAFSEALTRDPADGGALRGLGSALIALGKPALAVAQFKTALTAGADPRAYNGLAVALDRLGRHADAQANYRAGLALAPDDLALLNNLGLSLVLAGDFAAGTKVLARAATRPTATKRQRQTLALAYGLAGDTKTAARIARLDLDEAAVQKTLAYYQVLRTANQRKLAAAASAPPSRPSKSGPEIPALLPAMTARANGGERPGDSKGAVSPGARPVLQAILPPAIPASAQVIPALAPAAGPQLAPSAGTAPTAPKHPLVRRAAPLPQMSPPQMATPHAALAHKGPAQEGILEGQATVPVPRPTGPPTWYAAARAPTPHGAAKPGAGPTAASREGRGGLAAFFGAINPLPHLSAFFETITRDVPKALAAGMRAVFRRSDEDAEGSALTDATDPGAGPDSGPALPPAATSGSTSWPTVIAGI